MLQQSNANTLQQGLPDLSKASLPPAPHNPSVDLQGHFEADLPGLAADVAVDAMLVTAFFYGMHKMIRWIYSE